MKPSVIVPARPSRVGFHVPIHKALRSFMTDTLGRVGRVDVDDEADLTCMLDQLDELLAFCAAHVAHLESIETLRTEAQVLAAAPADARTVLAHRLYRHLALFVADNFQHMHIEETANNAVLWAGDDDAELHAVHAWPFGTLSSDEKLQVARWMVPALTPAERAAMLGAAQRDAPPEAYLATLAVVRPHLDDTAWAKLAAALGIVSCLPAAIG